LEQDGVIERAPPTTNCWRWCSDPRASYGPPPWRRGPGCSSVTTWSCLRRLCC